MSLKPATCSPLQMLHLRTAFCFFGSKPISGIVFFFFPKKHILYPHFFTHGCRFRCTIWQFFLSTLRRFFHNEYVSFLYLYCNRQVHQQTQSPLPDQGRSRYVSSMPQNDRYYVFSSKSACSRIFFPVHPAMLLSKCVAFLSDQISSLHHVQEYILLSSLVFRHNNDPG